MKSVGKNIVIGPFAIFAIGFAHVLSGKSVYPLSGKKAPLKKTRIDGNCRNCGAPVKDGECNYCLTQY